VKKVNRKAKTENHTIQTSCTNVKIDVQRKMTTRLKFCLCSQKVLSQSDRIEEFLNADMKLIKEDMDMDLTVVVPKLRLWIIYPETCR